MNKLSLLRKMILLERNVALLYSHFEQLFNYDALFWKQLVLEEINHASLLESQLEYIADSKEFNNNLLGSTEETIAAINDNLEKILQSLQTGKLTRENALSIALQIEQSAGEVHFQTTSTETISSIPVSIFQSLVDADKNHAERIYGYLNQVKNGKTPRGCLE